MVKNYGSPSKFQEAMTLKWIDELVNKHDFDYILFEGQVNLEFIHHSFDLHHFSDYKIILLDCSEDKMAYRLTHKRGQPELLTPEMKNWLKFLRNQARKLHGEIIDTTDMSSEDVVMAFEQKANLVPSAK